MAEKFKIWLDESGAFKDDKIDKYKNPSLVGGVLCKYNDFGNDIVNSIIVEDFFHANEGVDPERSLEIIGKIIEKKGQPIVFENSNKLNIVNGDITYINIFAEGIVKLIEHLISEHGKIEIEILKARRINVEHKENTGQTKIISDNEYVTRIKEKMIIGFIQKGINSRNVSWTFKLESARKDKRLMLSDCVCNVYLTRTARKFAKHKEELELMLSKYKEIKVLKKTSEDTIRQYLAQDNISSAIIDFISDEELFSNKEIEALIINSIKRNNNELVKVQMKAIGNKLEEIVNYRRDFLVAERILNRLKNSFLNTLKDNNIYFEDLGYYTLINCFSLYTHTGEIVKSQKVADEIQEYFNNNQNLTNEVIQQYFRFKNKLAVQLNNEFNFKAAINLLDKNIENIENRIMSDNMIKDDILKNNNSEVKNLELGKSLGTRVQSRIFLSRFDKSEIKKGMLDSDKALQVLGGTGDYFRQLQYRVILETEAGNFNEAMNLLKRSIFKSDDSSITLGEVVNSITKTDEINIFNLMHYCRVMGEAALENNPIADELYSELNSNIGKLKILTDDITEIENKDHPLEIVLWKMATYYSCKDMNKAAEKYYNKAIEIAKNSSDSITRQIIALAIMCEKSYFMNKAGKNFEKEGKKTLVEIEKLLKYIKESDISEQMKDFLEESFKDYKENAFEASRKVAY